MDCLKGMNEVIDYIEFLKTLKTAQIGSLSRRFQRAGRLMKSI